MIDGLKPYPEGKFTSSRWLKEVPSHWGVQSLRTLITPRAERNRPDLPLLSVAREKGVFVRSMTDPNENHNVIPEDLRNYKVARQGNLVINKMKAWQGSMGIAPCDGIVSPAYFVFDLSISNALFAQAMFRSKPYVAHFGQASDGVRVGQWDLSIPGMREIPVLLPPPDEQAAIVKFLDYANGKIERAIRAKRKLIGLLNEQKQAIIHRAVTRGLDPNVKLKPSGIPWLGDVPEHWEVVRFKAQVGFQEGPGIMAADFRDTGVPLLRISCLVSDEASLVGCNYLDPDKVKRKWSHFRIEESDYLLSASGSTGAVRKAGPLVKGAIAYTGIIRLWPKSEKLDMEYLRLFMSSQKFVDQISMAKSGVAIEHFGPTHLKRMWIFLPPIEEQPLIVEQIVEETSTITSATSRLEKEIEFLREYRTTLIAEVVTGKLDVRDAAKRLPDQAGEPLPLDDSMDDIVDDEIAEEIEA